MTAPTVSNALAPATSWTKRAPISRRAVRGADLVYVALPIGASIEALPAIAAAAEPGALVTDAGSTKAAICQIANEHFRTAALDSSAGIRWRARSNLASSTRTRIYFAARLMF